MAQQHTWKAMRTQSCIVAAAPVWRVSLSSGKATSALATAVRLRPESVTWIVSACGRLSSPAERYQPE